MHMCVMGRRNEGVGCDLLTYRDARSLELAAEPLVAQQCAELSRASALTAADPAGRTPQLGLARPGPAQPSPTQPNSAQPSPLL